MKKIKPSKGIIESLNDLPANTYDPDNFKLEDFVKYLDEEYERERNRKIQWNKDNQPKPPLTDVEIAIHKRSDALLGNYPMTKERLLELIELIPNALMNIDYYGMMHPVKAYNRMWITAMGDDMTSEQLYMNYLTEVKPYIQLK